MTSRTRGRERGRLWRAVAGVAGGLRTAWLVVGITLLMFLAAEGFRRTQLAARVARAPQPSVRDPQLDLPWNAEFAREFDAARTTRWVPYLYFSLLPSVRGRYVNIDDEAHRVTPQPSTPATPAARVWFMGGSTMWGIAQRDDFTLAAVAARRLQRLVQPSERIEVRNLGEHGYVFTQNIIQLMLELRAGRRPDVVVFYEGLNEAGSAVQWGAAGATMNESKRVAEYQRGRALDRTGYARGLRKDLRALGMIAGEATSHLELVNWVKSLRPAPAPRFVSADSAARSTVDVFVECVRIVEALAAEYDFTPIYVWQPNLHGTAKPLTPYERRIMQRIARDPFNNRLRETHLAIPPLLDSAMTGVVPGRFLDAFTLFRDDSTHVYVDIVGHTTEVANETIADAIWPMLQRAVAERLRRAPAGPTVTLVRSD